MPLQKSRRHRFLLVSTVMLLGSSKTCRRIKNTKAPGSKAKRNENRQDQHARLQLGHLPQQRKTVCSWLVHVEPTAILMLHCGCKQQLACVQAASHLLMLTPYSQVDFHPTFGSAQGTGQAHLRLALLVADVGGRRRGRRSGHVCDLRQQGPLGSGRSVLPTHLVTFGLWTLLVGPIFPRSRRQNDIMTRQQCRQQAFNLRSCPYSGGANTRQ